MHRIIWEGESSPILDPTSLLKQKKAEHILDLAISP
jgi:hypothetical protein